jgi:DNA-binding GntR family transcriptional regulator
MTSIDMAVPILDALEDRILDLLANSPEPLTAEALRSRLQVRNQRLVEALRQLSSESKIQRLANGYMLLKLSR